MNRRVLQIVTAVLALVVIATGILSMFGISDPLFAGLNLPASPTFDSTLRFYGGQWLGPCPALAPSIH
jgi:hypothetical protein